MAKLLITDKVDWTLQSENPVPLPDRDPEDHQILSVPKSKSGRGKDRRKVSAPHHELRGRGEEGEKKRVEVTRTPQHQVMRLQDLIPEKKQMLVEMMAGRQLEDDLIKLDLAHLDQLVADCEAGILSDTDRRNVTEIIICEVTRLQVS